MRKTYLSLAVSRAYALDHPVGDPFGGPAFGERRMPLVAIVAAGFAAAEIATVGIAAMSAFEVIASVGAITSGIGAITGNDKLMKIGGIMGLAGGVGMFAQNQGWIGAADAATQSTTEAAASAGTQSAQAAQVTEAAGGNVAKAAQGGADVGKALESAAATPGVEQVIDTAQSSAQGGGLMAPQVGSNLQVPSAVTSAAPGAAPVGEFANESQKLLQQQSIAQAGGNLLNTNLPTVDLNSASPSWLDNFKKVGKFMEENKTMATIGAAAIGGMFDKEKDARADRYAAESELLRQQQANMATAPTAGVTQPRPSVFRTTQPSYTPVGLMRPVTSRG